MLRYSSETYNKRVRDVAVLRDRVPREKCHLLAGAANWAQGRGNLYHPFCGPNRGDYFQDFAAEKKTRAVKKASARKARVAEQKEARAAIRNASTVATVLLVVVLYFASR